MNHRGITLIELLVVVVLIGLLTALAFPRIGDMVVRQDVRSARGAVTTLIAKARALAVQRARETTLVHDNNRVVVISRHPVTGAIDTVQRPIDLFDRYGVTTTWTRDNLVFDARGLGNAGSATFVVFSKAGVTNTIEVSPVGSIMR